ncbi:glycoside hydrolase family 43 protein [Glaciihabitans sp. dw_435]|uniref:glycoside hydrolase family 43 protein n=1 Tax=Glaciihabitans sp. dw_435 TaxID=2720081 RepID=UPI001BD31079|nr:glycoside hydrolase family 43 protein [Glaciihabitans sp. dw_435]
MSATTTAGGTTGTTEYPNPLIPGFNPDPSAVKVGDDYYLVTSTFEYLPGIPVYHSTDLVDWTQIGNVATRPEQLDLATIPTLGGVWAPTIRFRDGVFYVIVTVAMGGGCVVFTATDPAGPWSDPTLLSGIAGIDPDLAWGDDGTAYVTFSGLTTTGPDAGAHHGVQQVKVDLETGEVLEEPRSLWSGTGLKFPEAPHIYHRGPWWYLMIAEGGTERGHGVSMARGLSPEGPFTGFDGNPFLSARSTSRPIQNTGHADLIETPDGGSALILLGMRPRGMTQAFSALGRETFITTLAWKNDWPVAEPVILRPRAGETRYSIDFAGVDALDAGWLAIRRVPAEVAAIDGGKLVLHGEGATLDDTRPVFLGRRQLNQTARVSTVIDASSGTGGLVVRYDEDYHTEIEVSGTRVTGRVHLAGVAQEWTLEVPAGPLELRMSSVPIAAGFGPSQLSSDRIILSIVTGGEETVIAETDGRYLSAETAASFTGRVIGVYAVDGTVRFDRFDYVGSED